MEKERVVGIYKITNKINGKSYIGQSNNIIRRISEHKSESYRQHEINKVLYKAIKKYGIQNFDFDIIEECYVDELDDRERYWIDYFDCYKNGYNCTLGGKGFDGYIDDCSDEERYYLQLDKKEQFITSIYKKEDAFFSAEDMNFENSFYSPFDETVEDMTVKEVEDYADGYDTMINDFCDGYPDFESWAECNLI